MTGLQCLSSKVIMLWFIYLKSLQELLGTSWDMEERSFGKLLADEEEGWMLKARVWRFHAFTLPWESLKWSRNCLSYYLWRRLQTARTSCLPFNRLGFSKPQQPQKISQNAVTVGCPFPGIVSNVFKGTTVTKEFSKCHSWWQFCHLPRIVFYWLLRSHGDIHQRLPCRLLKMPCNGRWCYFLE